MQTSPAALPSPINSSFGSFNRSSCSNSSNNSRRPPLQPRQNQRPLQQAQAQAREPRLEALEPWFLFPLLLQLLQPCPKTCSPQHKSCTSTKNNSRKQPQQPLLHKLHRRPCKSHKLRLLLQRPQAPRLLLLPLLLLLNLGLQVQALVEQLLLAVLAVLVVVRVVVRTLPSIACASSALLT